MLGQGQALRVASQSLTEHPRLHGGISAGWKNFASVRHLADTQESGMLGRFVAIFLIIVVAKVVYNIRNLLWMKYYFKKYEEYRKSGGKGWYIRERKQRIVGLFGKAGVKDNYIPFEQLAGEPPVQTVHHIARLSVFQNITELRQGIVPYIVSAFKEAIAVFKHRIVQSFSPIYWLESFLFLPKKTLTYLGINGNSVFGRVSQLVWWLMNLAGIVGSTVFNAEFRVWSNRYLPAWLSNFLGN
jgi:hypothetical protein